MEESEQPKESVEHEFDPEMALVAAEAKAEQEAELAAAAEEEIIINEDNEEKEENEENDGKVILRAKKKKKNFVNYDANNYNNTNNTKNKNNKNYNNNNYNNKNTNTNNNVTLTKKKVVLKKDLIYDPDYDAQSNYFYQNITDSDWDKIKSFLRKAFTGQIPSEEQLKSFFEYYSEYIKITCKNANLTVDELGELGEWEYKDS